MMGMKIHGFSIPTGLPIASWNRFFRFRRQPKRKPSKQSRSAQWQWLKSAGSENISTSFATTYRKYPLFAELLAAALDVQQATVNISEIHDLIADQLV
jgi:hypothetical protein